MKIQNQAKALQGKLVIGVHCENKYKCENKKTKISNKYIKTAFKKFPMHFSYGKILKCNF